MKSLYSYIITESLDELYHFTTTDCGYEICKDDTFSASWDDGHNPEGYPYYMSTTRQRNALTGYPQGMLSFGYVRFVLDGKLLNSKFKIKPMDTIHGKGQVIKVNWEDKEAFDRAKQDIMLQPNVESEDRVLLKQDSIKDFHKYIKEIHFTSRAKGFEHHPFSEYCRKYNITFKLMTEKEYLRGR